jgi:hypothetical protein
VGLTYLGQVQAFPTEYTSNLDSLDFWMLLSDPASPLAWELASTVLHFDRIRIPEKYQEL